MFSGMRALVLPHNRKGFFRDRPEFLRIHFLLEVQHWADVQATHRGVRVPRSRGAVLSEKLVEAAGVFCKVRQFHRTILNARDRFAVALHGHHDVES